jgi:hypothetical protein
VLASRREELLARPGVTGVGIGRGEQAGTFVIVCYLDAERDTHGLPTALDGVPVTAEQSGEFRAQENAG